MLRHPQLGLIALGVFALALSACGSDDETMPPEIVSFEIASTTAAAGDTVSGTAELMHFMLVDPGGDHDHSADEGHEHGGDGDVMTGHIHAYFDSFDTNPIAMTGEATFDMMIPDDATAGEHTIMIRLHSAEHLIIEPQVTAEVTITIE